MHIKHLETQFRKEANRKKKVDISKVLAGVFYKCVEQLICF